MRRGKKILKYIVHLLLNSPLERVGFYPFLKEIFFIFMCDCNIYNIFNGPLIEYICIRVYK